MCRRHRYEVNPAKIKELEKAGLKFVGMDETGQVFDARIPSILTAHPRES